MAVAHHHARRTGWLRRIRDWLAERAFRRCMADLDRREAEAKARGQTRAIGEVRKERRDRINRALGWRSGSLSR